MKKYRFDLPAHGANAPAEVAVVVRHDVFVPARSLLAGCLLRVGRWNIDNRRHLPRSSSGKEQIQKGQNRPSLQSHRCTGTSLPSHS